jgi:6-phosphogluconolactonase
MEVLTHGNPAAVAQGATNRIINLMVAAPTRFTLGLAGGSTPEATYRLLRDQGSGWNNVDAWLSDERWASPDSDRSNGHMASNALFDHVDANLMRPEWSETMTPNESAESYESALRTMFGDRRPDVVMLGMGDDGHTASLFPGTKMLDVRNSWYTSGHVPQQGEDRLTATYPLLWHASLIIVLAVGANKASAVKASFDGVTPAGRLGEGDAAVEWYLDQESASALV